MKCCIETWTGSDELPFRRILASGYYDGPTEGICSCSICGQGYAFRLLAWDKNQDVRVFGFSQTAPNEKQVADELQITLANDKPVTIVPPLTAEKDERFKRLMEQPPTHLCVSDGLPGRARLWRRMSSRDEKVTDWFAHLNQGNGAE